MGLAGALVVRPPTPNQAYGDAASAYDVEAPMVLGAVDPAFNAAPDTYDLHAYQATYWLINGRSYPDTVAVTASAGQRVLLRYVNTGYDNTTMLLLGMHAGSPGTPGRCPARSTGRRDDPAGATEDAIATGRRPRPRAPTASAPQPAVARDQQAGPDRGAEPGVLAGRHADLHLGTH
jgi:FtsP/CotA-like multicopper oxidase with cupredoxin domain